MNAPQPPPVALEVLALGAGTLAVISAVAAHDFPTLCLAVLAPVVVRHAVQDAAMGHPLQALY